MIRLYRFQYSTNAERVALALAHKGLPFDPVEIDPKDRTSVRKISGQDLVPVIEDDGKVVIDSMEIVRWIEGRYPDRPLYPRDPARRAEMLVFIDWFNRVWKRPPNEITDELEKPEGARDAARIERLTRVMQSHLDLFEMMLAGRRYLQGEFSAADIAAFPFVKYATFRDPADTELFHEVLVRAQQPGAGHPRLVDWIARVDKHPRA